MPRPGRLVVLLAYAVASWGQDAIGTWKVNPSRSVFGPEPHPKEINLRIERHAKREVVTLDRILPSGLATTTSIILSLDGRPRDFHGETCSGTQSSQRLDDGTVEVRFQCQDGRSIRVRRRVVPQTRDLVLDIWEQPPGARLNQWRLVLEKQ